MDFARARRASPHHICRPALSVYSYSFLCPPQYRQCQCCCDRILILHMALQTDPVLRAPAPRSSLLRNPLRCLHGRPRLHLGRVVQSLYGRAHSVLCFRTRLHLCVCCGELRSCFGPSLECHLALGQERYMCCCCESGERRMD